MQAKRPRKPKRKKKVITATDKRMIEQARRELAAGKTMTLAELLMKALERDARKHAA